MNIEQLAAAIKSVESGGNYTVQGIMTRYGRATGAYQFLDGTWGSYGGYEHASDAPPEVQDKKALATMKSMASEFARRNPGLDDNAISRLVAIAWHAGMGTALKAMTIGSAGTSDGLITTDDYALRVLKAMGKPTKSTKAATVDDAMPTVQLAEDPNTALAGSLSRIFGKGGILGADATESMNNGQPDASQFTTAAPDLSTPEQVM